MARWVLVLLLLSLPALAARGEDEGEARLGTRVFADWCRRKKLPVEAKQHSRGAGLVPAHEEGKKLGES